MRRLFDPIHPGEILAEEFLVPLGLTQYRLAKETGVPARRINEIVKGKRSVTADTALRLAKYFGTSEIFWLNLQARYDLDVEKDRLGKRLDAEVRVFRRETASISQHGRPTGSERRQGVRRSGYTRRSK